VVSSPELVENMRCESEHEVHPGGDGAGRPRQVDDERPRGAQRPRIDDPRDPAREQPARCLRGAPAPQLLGDAGQHPVEQRCGALGGRVARPDTRSPARHDETCACAECTPERVRDGLRTIRHHDGVRAREPRRTQRVHRDGTRGIRALTGRGAVGDGHDGGTQTHTRNDTGPRSVTRRPTGGDNRLMARRTEDFRGLTQPSRLRLLAEVQAEPGLLLRELAARLGLHENTVRDHLLVLEAEGLITRQTVHAGRRGRPPETYHPVRDAGHNAEAARRVQTAAQHGDLLRRMQPDAHAAELDTAALHQIDALYEHLDDAGFEPELDDRALEIDLVPCPFTTLVDDEPELVCRVHSQLIRDTLSQVPGPLRLQLLEPRLSHTLCRVHLAVGARSDAVPAPAGPGTASAVG